MKVSRAQAEENRRTVINVAGHLFRERGFDGIGLNDLMSAAGLTHGGFYKQFKSKDDLIVQACERALADSAETWSGIVENGGDDPLTELIDHYLSCGHRDHIGEGCAFAALGPDAVRHGATLIRRFEESIKSHLDILDRATQVSSSPTAADDPVVIFSTMVGALVLSRIVEDEALSRRILDTAANSLLNREGN
jgi:TetR/AcrR family transcriptional repressor of nem operon